MNEPAARALPVAAGIDEPAEFGLVVECLVARAHRRLAWLQTLDGDVDADEACAELDWQATSEAGAVHAARVESADAALERSQAPAFDTLCRAFALEPTEREIFMTALAVRLDPRLLALCQQLQGRPWATEELVARLFGHGRRPLWNCNGALATWALVHTREAAPAEPPPLVVDPAVPFWLQGDGHLDEELAGQVQPLQTPEPLAGWPVSETATRIREHWDRRNAVRLLVEGGPDSGRTSFAAAVAQALGRSALAVHGCPDGLPWPRLWMLVQRQSVVSGSVPVWRGGGQPWPRHVPPAMVQAFCVESAAELADEPRAADVRVRLPALDGDSRARLLARFVPESAAWSASQRARLANRPGVVVGDLARLRRQGASSLAEAEAELRFLCAERLGEQAERLETDFRWDDLVLPAPLAETLRDFAFEAESRIAVWERADIRRLFPAGRSLVALFAGPPQTKKGAAMPGLRVTALKRVLAGLGAVLAMQGKFAQAIEQWKQALQYADNTKLATLYFYIGSGYKDMGKPELSGEWFEKAYAIDPSLQR